MGPKKPNKASKKNVEKKKDQKVDDKTFGLKNKNKSKVVQQYVAQVKCGINGGPQQQKDRQKKIKAAKDKEATAMKDLFMAAIKQPTVPPGTDPKSLVCEFFKHGCCTKGLRCKFSHDLNVGRKAAKIDLYSDKRDADEKATEDTIDKWDQTKLEEVITEMHGAANQTEIVCKYFLDAIEKTQYGWFWTCPNGGKACKYRHALPQGYVYKTKEERDIERTVSKVKVCMEDLIEEQRAKLGSAGGTPVTAESLEKWKVDKASRKASQLEEKRKAEAKKSGTRGLNVLSGRALFTYDPTLFQDDMDAAAEYEQHGEEEDDVEVDEAAKAMDESLYVDEESFICQPCSYTP